MTRIKFKFEGAEHVAYLDEDNKWWREDGVHYRLEGHKPSALRSQVFPLIRMRPGTVVRINGTVSVEYDDFESIETSYYESFGTPGEETLIDGLAFIEFLERAEKETGDFGWFEGEEFFVYKAFPMTPDAEKAAWRAFFWQQRRKFIQADVLALQE